MTVLADDTLGAGFVAFIVVLVLIAACVFLFRSMIGHLRKVPKSFDAGSPDDESEQPDQKANPASSANDTN